MIRIDELTFSYGGRRVYDGLSTRFENDAVYGLLGKNGAGKTTLLRLMAGLMRCGDGKIEVNGQTPHRRNPGFLDKVYYVPENFNAPDIRVIDYAGGFGGFYSGYDEKALLDYLTEFEVNPHDRFRKLSFGQRKKAIIAFALSLNAELLLLDEPGNGLDIPSKLSLRRMLSEYQRPGRTVILSTHQVRDIEDIVDHVTVIDEGRLMLNASVSEIENTVTFVHSDRILTDTLFSERVSDGYINIIKRGSSLAGMTYDRSRIAGRHGEDMDRHGDTGDTKGNTAVAEGPANGGNKRGSFRDITKSPAVNSVKMDMEVLFDACTIGGRSFTQYITAASGKSREEVSYVL